MIRALHILYCLMVIYLATYCLYLSLPDSYYFPDGQHILPFHDFLNSENNRDNSEEVIIHGFKRRDRKVFNTKRILKNGPWQSYIVSTEVSQYENRTAAYDSRNIWVYRTCDDYEKEIPDRPTAKFKQIIDKLCDVKPEACKLFTKTLVDTWDNSVKWLKDGSVYLITGDIAMMWLRDSTAQVTHYLALADEPAIQQLIEGVLKRQMKWIEMDPYGSAFRMYLDFDHAGKRRLTDWDFKCGRTIHVAQHDYEMDSLSYVVRLAYLYWRKTGRTCWMEGQLQETVNSIVDLWILEQNHTLLSTYRYPTLKNDGRGTPVCYTGMTWSGMRPSDDSMKYHYNIPTQLFAVTVLGYIQEMTYLWADKKLRLKAKKLQSEILQGVYKYGVIDGTLAYEVDGCGNYLLADDANIPSLLSLPYLGVNIPEELYKTTREFILSVNNPWYTNGSRVSGIGSPHTQGRGKVWHLALIMEGLTGGDTLDMVLATAKDGLHESVSASSTGYTRYWFGWANALFAEWMMTMI